jgi:NADP-dependent alcohol dehydrogenase
MENFNFYNPVKILFGKGKIAELPDNLPQNANILFVYGSGSIKKNGIYNQVINNLKGFEYHEFAGIEPNPSYETCMKAVEIVKAKNINFLLAVGGGSVIDAVKFIAAASLFEGDNPWDIISKGAEVKKALPIGVVLTIPATGSEMNINSVITKKETAEKLPFKSQKVYPKFSILDPEYSFSLPKRQIVNGVIDAFIHVIEQYLTYPVNSPVQDRFAEGVLLTLIEEGRKAVFADKPDYDNRANITWAATLALNGLLAVGVKSCWATHAIGHELTALHGLDHAVSLTIVLQGLLDRKRAERSEKLLQYGERVWNIKAGSKEERIDKTIKATEDFFKELGVKTRLSDYNITEDTIDFIVNRYKNRGLSAIGLQKDISIDDVKQILLSRL